MTTRCAAVRLWLNIFGWRTSDGEGSDATNQVATIASAAQQQQQPKAQMRFLNPHKSESVPRSQSNLGQKPVAIAAAAASKHNKPQPAAISKEREMQLMWARRGYNVSIVGKALGISVPTEWSNNVTPFWIVRSPILPAKV